MAEKKRSRRARKNDVLMPHVADDAELQVGKAELSAEARRARDAVDELIRDLFGGNTTESAASAASSNSIEEIEQVVEVPEPVEEESSALVEESESLDPVQEPEVLSMEEEDIEVELPFEEEEPLSLKEQVEGSNEDFRLLLDMEYEKELGDAIGFERIRAYHERSINGRKAGRRRKEKVSGEYETQDKDVEIGIRHRYVRMHSRWILRLALSFVLFVLILLYENNTWMADLFGGPLDGAKYPVPYILIGMQLLLFAAVICYKPLWEGLCRILRFSPVDYSAHVGVLLVTFGYHIVLLFMEHTQAPVLFLSPAAFCLVVLAAVELLNSYREAYAFEVVAKRQQKYAMLPRVSVGSVQDSARARLEAEEGGANAWYLRPIGFVRNYFENTERHASRHRNLGAHFLMILGLGAALGLFTYAGGNGGARVWGFILVAVLLCAPVISAVLTSLPLFFSGVFCLKQNGAIIGEGPLEEGSDGDVLVLPDNELFLSMERERFRLLDLCDAHRVTVLLRALLDKIQSPLAASFGVDSDSRLSTADVTISHIGEEGICAELPRYACRVSLGTAEYMTERGMSVKQVAESEDRPLYVAVDDRVCAVFYVRYTPCADLESLLHELHRAGLRVAIRSKDPCVRADVFERLFEGRVAPVAVQKPSANELDLRTERVDATVVAVNSCKQLARTVITCRRVGRVGVWGKVLQFICVLGGAALAAMMTYLDMLLPGVLVTLWICFWCGLYTLVSYFYLRRPTEDI